MSEEIEVRKLTKAELRNQLDRIVQYNINPNWDTWQINQYYAGITSIRKWASRRTITSRGYYHCSIEEIYKYLEETNGEVKKDKLTLKEEEIERRYEEKKQEEKRKREEEKEKKKEYNSKKGNKFLKYIVDFFKKIKNIIVKKLKAGDKKLSLDSGDIGTPRDIKPRDEFIEQLREGIEENQVDEIKSQETRINNNNIKNKRKNDER